jgi:phage/plasmid-associated DNA primase
MNFSTRVRTAIKIWCASFAEWRASLTGLTREHALFFLHGPGSNGKSVFAGALAGVMSDYAQAAPIRDIHRQHI